MKALWLKIVRPFMTKIAYHRMTTTRVALKFCDYTTADALLRENKGWELAEEEDTNHAFGCVYLERRE